MTLSENELSWATSNSDIGSHNVKIGVTDTANNEIELAYQLAVLSSDSGAGMPC